MSTSTSYKVSYTGEGKVVEVRRFLVSQEMFGDFKHLRGKLLSVFPRLGLEIFSLFWKDDEGDEITISSDEDLLIALGEMEGPVYKLGIKITERATSVESISEEDDSVHNSETPSDDFQQWSGVFTSNTGDNTNNMGPQEQTYPIIPPMLLTILHFLGINPNGFYFFPQSEGISGNPSNQCPFGSQAYHGIIQYVVTQFLRVTAMFTRASITLSSITIMLFIMMVLPSFFIHTVLYLAFAASLGFPLPTLLGGHLLFLLISCAPTFLVATAAIWAFHRITVQKKPLVEVDLEFWKRGFETLFTRLQHQHQA